MHGGEKEEGIWGRGGRGVELNKLKTSGVRFKSLIGKEYKFARAICAWAKITFISSGCVEALIWLINTFAVWEVKERKVFKSEINS